MRVGIAVAVGVGELLFMANRGHGSDGIWICVNDDAVGMFLLAAGIASSQLSAIIHGQTSWRHCGDGPNALDAQIRRWAGRRC